MTTPKSKLTPEERLAAKELKAQRLAEENARFEKEHAAEIAEYKAGLPKRLMDAQALANKLGVDTEVRLTPTGPTVTFSNDTHNIDETLTYESSSWEVEYIEDKLAILKKIEDDAAARRACAQSAWNNLTEDQKACIKEFIHWMR